MVFSKVCFIVVSLPNWLGCFFLRQAKPNLALVELLELLINTRVLRHQKHSPSATSGVRDLVENENPLLHFTF